jgi:hypothetical protein
MSYDIGLNTYSDEPLSDEQHNDALAILERYGAGPLERADGFSVRWDDGTGLVMYCKSFAEPPTPLSALLCPLDGLSERFCDFIYDFAFATRCAIRADVIPPVTLIVHPAILADLPQTVAATKGAPRLQRPCDLQCARPELLRVAKLGSADRRRTERARPRWRSISLQRNTHPYTSLSQAGRKRVAGCISVGEDDHEPRAMIMTKLKRELFIWAILTVTALAVGYVLYTRGLLTGGLRF